MNFKIKKGNVPGICKVFIEDCGYPVNISIPSPEDWILATEASVSMENEREDRNPMNLLREVVMEILHRPGTAARVDWALRNSNYEMWGSLGEEISRRFNTKIQDLLLYQDERSLVNRQGLIKIGPDATYDEVPTHVAWNEFRKTMQSLRKIMHDTQEKNEYWCPVVSNNHIMMIPNTDMNEYVPTEIISAGFMNNTPPTRFPALAGLTLLKPEISAEDQYRVTRSVQRINLPEGVEPVWTNLEVTTTEEEIPNAWAPYLLNIDGKLPTAIMAKAKGVGGDMFLIRQSVAQAITLHGIRKESLFGSNHPLVKEGDKIYKGKAYLTLSVEGVVLPEKVAVALEKPEWSGKTVTRTLEEHEDSITISGKLLGIDGKGEPVFANIPQEGVVLKVDTTARVVRNREITSARITIDFVVPITNGQKVICPQGACKGTLFILRDQVMDQVAGPEIDIVVPWQKDSRNGGLVASMATGLLPETRIHYKDTYQGIMATLELEGISNMYTIPSGVDLPGGKLWVVADMHFPQGVAKSGYAFATDTSLVNAVRGMKEEVELIQDLLFPTEPGEALIEELMLLC